MVYVASLFAGQAGCSVVLLVISLLSEHYWVEHANTTLGVNVATLTSTTTAFLIQVIHVGYYKDAIATPMVASLMAAVIICLVSTFSLNILRGSWLISNICIYVITLSMLCYCIAMAETLTPGYVGAFFLFGYQVTTDQLLIISDIMKQLGYHKAQRSLVLKVASVIGLFAKLACGVISLIHWIAVIYPQQLSHSYILPASLCLLGFFHIRHALEANAESRKLDVRKSNRYALSQIISGYEFSGRGADRDP